MDEIAAYDEAIEALHARYGADAAAAAAAVVGAGGADDAAAAAAAATYDVDVHYPRLLRVALVWGR